MSFQIRQKKVGKGCPVFIIAELSANHLQDFAIALKTVKAAAECGADAIKLQTFTADTLTLNEKSERFRVKLGSVWDGQAFYDLYKKAYMPWEWQPELMKAAQQAGMVCFSTPFDKTAVDFLEKMKVPAYKIASFEITDIPLIEYVAAKKKPVILSTGIATKSDIQEAVAACRRSKNNQIALLKCASAYPSPLEDVNLKLIPELEKDFGCVTGISDHTLGIAVSAASVALGAKIIEKHFILDRKLGSLDAGFSLEPKELKELVIMVRAIEKALGKVSYRLTKGMKKGRLLARSLFAAQDIASGEVFTPENTRSIRPGGGLHPKYLKDILGKKAAKDILGATPLAWNMIGKK